MRNYELAIIFQNALKEAERAKLLDTIKGWLKDLKVVKEDSWGEKPFAYPIKRQKSGFYYVLQVEGETFPTDFEKKVYGNEQVLRHLIMRTK